MIMNIFSEEGYDHELMKKNRLNAINQARNSKTWGIILGKLFFLNFFPGNIYFKILF